MFLAQGLFHSKISLDRVRSLFGLELQFLWHAPLASPNPLDTSEPLGIPPRRTFPAFARLLYSITPAAAFGTPRSRPPMITFCVMRK